ncbi:MAG: DeoR family transcriptional regulator [bacterium]
MDKDFLIQLTKRLYRLTLLFPQKEPLRYKMREQADEILAGFIGNSAGFADLAGREKLEILDGFFEIAKSQDWVSSKDCLILQEEYNKLKEFAAAAINLPQKETEQVAAFLTRQEKILGFLKEKGRAQVGELKQVFPQISKRTLRRDFENLLGQGLIERRGNKNDTFYQLRQITTEI